MVLSALNNIYLVVGWGISVRFEIRRPIVHEPSPTLEQVRTRIGGVDFVLDHVRERGLDNLDDPLPSVSLSTAVLTIHEGMSQTVAIIAQGDLANAVMRVRVQVTGDALPSLLQDGNGLRASGSGTYTLDLGGNTSTVLTIRADGDGSLADNQTQTATLTIVDAGGADIGDQDRLTVTVRGCTVVPALPVVGRLLLALFMMAPAHDCIDGDRVRPVHRSATCSCGVCAPLSLHLQRPQRHWFHRLGSASAAGVHRGPTASSNSPLRSV